MRIGIDIDDTICSTNELIVKEAQKYDRNVIHGSGIKDKNAYDFTKMMGWDKNEKGKFFAYRLEYIMKNTKLKRNARKYINKLFDEGFEIYFISFRKDKYITDPYKLTKDYLHNNGIKYNNLIVNSGDKGKVCNSNNIDLFIDDNIAHCVSVSSYGINCLLFDSIYNRDNNDFKRVYNWKEIYNYIHSMGENNG